MQNNYYFLNHLVAQLKPLLVDKTIAESFSQQKNELILGFRSNHDSLYLKASLLPEFTCLSILEDFQRAKRNSVNLFTPLLGQKVTEIYQAINERTFIIKFEGNKALYFKMHGNRANIIFFEGEKIASLFKRKLIKDNDLTLADVDRPIDQSYDAFKKVAGDFTVLFPTFGNVIKQYLVQNDYDNKVLADQWKLIQSVLALLKHPKFYILNIKEKLVFSMLPIGEIVKTFDDPIESITQFYYTYQKHFKFNREKTALIKALDLQKRKTENYVLKTQAKLEKLEKSRKHDEIANIIMANLNQIPANTTKVELFDFYQNETIAIKLKMGLSPQKNAEQYYRKAKNQKLETNQLKQNIAHKNNELARITEQLAAVKNVEDFKTLKLHLKHKPEAKSLPLKAVPYKKVVFQGFEILIGKHAAANDELTQKVAKKDDLWLHAKDVSGSHVVIRNAGIQKFPSQVIEYAAALAAFHSKRKNDTLCPVIYTAKKYVRKPKSALPGQVIVEKEQVMLVEPKNYTA